MTKFKNKYRIESHRLKGWDYGSNALYFVTICCKNRRYFFGTVEDDEMILSDIGKIVDTYWQAIPEHFPKVILHNHIIMPNHMHGIIEITSSAQTAKLAVSTNKKTPNLGVSTNKKTANLDASNIPETPRLGISTTQKASEKWNPGTLGVIINQYKRICTINARKINPKFGWQPNYHDIIIRNQKSYHNISNYIANNPKKWQQDTFKNK